VLLRFGLADRAADEAGAAAPIRLRAEVRREDDDRVAEVREAPAGEKAEEKERADKAFAERKEIAAAKLAREKSVSDRTVLVAKASIEALLRERNAFLVVDKPKESKGKHK